MDTATRPVVLSERHRTVLWMLSQGYPRRRIARETGWSQGSVQNQCHLIMTSLGADNMVQAAVRGVLDGHIGPYRDCGGPAAYQRHLKRDKPLCFACRRGHRERASLRGADRPLARVDGSHVRLLRVLDAGRTEREIRRMWDLTEPALDKLLMSVYTVLGVDSLPAENRRDAALREARVRGLLDARMPQSPPPPRLAVRLSDTQLRILEELNRGATVAEAAKALGMRRRSCESRISEAYQLLDVAWMEQRVRRDAALRRARDLNLLPSPSAA